MGPTWRASLLVPSVISLSPRTVDRLESLSHRRFQQAGKRTRRDGIWRTRAGRPVFPLAVSRWRRSAHPASRGFRVSQGRAEIGPGSLSRAAPEGRGPPSARASARASARTSVGRLQGLFESGDARCPGDCGGKSGHATMASSYPRREPAGTDTNADKRLPMHRLPGSFHPADL